MNPPGWLVDRLPEWARSIRFRYTLLYSAVLFGLAAVVVAAIYLVLVMSLRNEPYSSGVQQLICVPGDRCYQPITFRQLERAVNARTLKELRNYSFTALGVLFVASLGVGWVVAGRVQRPIGRITSVARDIQATDLSRRIELPGPDDELKQLGDTFDAMLARLDAAFAAQRQFVADASHELRTPLTAIRTNVEFLARVPSARTEDRVEALRDVLTELRRMETLVGDLLALARLEAAAVRPARRTFRLDHMLADVHRDALRTAPTGVEVALGPLPEVWASGDRDDLRRAVWNLVDNALKYTREGKVDLRLRAGDGTAELSVRDTGIGIAEGHLDHVFDRFWRAPSVRGMAGSGLGLAITRWVVQAHEGTITVSSAVGHGTTFVVTLPVVQGPPRQSRRPQDADVQPVSAR